MEEEEFNEPEVNLNEALVEKLIKIVEHYVSHKTKLTMNVNVNKNLKESIIDPLLLAEICQNNLITTSNTKRFKNKIEN